MLAGLAAWILTCLTSAHGQAVDSLAAPQTPAAAQELPAPTTLADTAVYAQGRNSRIGFNSFVFTNSLLGRIRRGRWHSWAEGGQSFLYNQNLGRGGGRFLQKDYYLRGEQTFALTPTLTVGHRVGVFAFTAIGNSFARYEGLARWQPSFPRVLLYTELSGGIAADKRGSIQNVGPAVSGRVWGTALSRDSATEYSWQAQTSQAFINPRQMSLWALKAGLLQDFGGFAQTRISGGYLRRRVEDFFLGHIQQILSDSLEANLFLGSRLGRRFTFQSDNRLLVPTRQFNYRPYDSTPTPLQNTRFNQTEIYSNQSLAFESDAVRQTLSVTLQQRNRVYGLDNNLDLEERTYNRSLAQERIKNITEQSIGYGYNGAVQVSRRSSVRGSLTGSLLRVNTPSDQNDQDRDEAFYTADLGWQHRWLTSLRTGFKLSGSYRHVIFIRGTQSAQNYIERVLRMEPTLSYSLGRVRLSGSFAVWATYNVRDFEAEQAKNRANRIWMQTYQVRYTPKLGWYTILDLVRRENRIAQLNWTRFRETPIDTVVATDGHARLGRTWKLPSSHSELSGEVGYRLFRQDRHYVAGVTQIGSPTRQAALHNIVLQQGPAAALVWELPGRGRITLDGWLQYATTRNRYKLGSDIFVGQTFSAEDLAKVDRRVYLFFNLTGSILIR